MPISWCWSRLRDSVCLSRLQTKVKPLYNKQKIVVSFTASITGFLLLEIQILFFTCISNIGAFNFCDFTLCNFFIVDFIKNNIIYNFYVINGDYAKISSPQKIRRYSIYQALLQFVFVSDFSYQCAGGRLLLWFCPTFDGLDQESQTHARWFVLLDLVLNILFCKSVKLAILSFLYILAFMNK